MMRLSKEQLECLHNCLTSELPDDIAHELNCANDSQALASYLISCEDQGILSIRDFITTCFQERCISISNINEQLKQVYSSGTCDITVQDGVDIQIPTDTFTNVLLAQSQIIHTYYKPNGAVYISLTPFAILKFETLADCLSTLFVQT